MGQNAWYAQFGKETAACIQKEAIPSFQKEGDNLTLEERQKAYTNAYVRYGESAQIMVALEELSELQKELCKFFRHCSDGSDINIDGIVDETADVRIMLEQIEMIFGIEDCVAKRMDYKINRLNERLKG